MTSSDLADKKFNENILKRDYREVLTAEELKERSEVKKARYINVP